MMYTIDKLRNYLRAHGAKALLMRVKVKAEGVFLGLYASRQNRSLRKNRYQSRIRLAGSSKLIQDLLARDVNLDGDQKVQWIAKLFDEEYFKASLQVLGVQPEGDLFNCYLEKWVDEDISPHPLFDVEVFRSKAATLGIKPLNYGVGGWLRDGVDAKIVPNCLIDEQWMAESKQGVPSHGLAQFEALLVQGLDNEVSANQWFDPDWYRERHGTEIGSSTGLEHYLVTGYKKGYRPSADFPIFSRSQCMKMERSPLQEYLDRDSGLDVGDLRALKSQSRSDYFESVVSKVLDGFQGAQFELVLIIPRCGLGGAARLAGIFCDSLGRVLSLNKVLLIRADDELFLRPDWFPDGLANINFQDHVHDFEPSDQIDLLYRTLQRLKPNVTVVMNSLVAWNMVLQRAKGLKEFTKLVGYDFCYAVTKTGQKAGFPVSHIPQAIDHLDLLFLDNQFLKDDLISNHRWPVQVQDRIHVLYTPMDAPDNGYQWSPRDIPANEQPRIYWAGRFDRQKRLNVAVELAKRNAQWSFHVWGIPMLDGPLDCSDHPQNFHVHGPYEQIDDLDFQSCDVWLYTAEWDGVPQQLIELGLRGVATVSSSVWGMSEVINAATAFPVDDIYSIDAYQAQLDFALSHKQERLSRGKEFKSQTTQQHSFKQFDLDVHRGLRVVGLV